MGRAFRLAGVAVVLSGVIVGGVAVAGAPAFAGTTNPTTLTVTGNKTTITSGQPIAFNAVVGPSKVGTSKISGTVVWTVTGQDGSVVPCANIPVLSSGGKSKCSISHGVLLAAASPYVASASYSGDANFDPSTGSGNVPVTPTTTHVKLSFDAFPTPGAATVVTATVVDGPASVLISGIVQFVITSQYHGSGAPPRCIGTQIPVANNNKVPVSAQTAVCNLPANWMVLPRMSASNPKPSCYWSISANYNGTTSFFSSIATKATTAR